MRILMLGRGVIATIYGQALQHSGHHVDHLVRPGRAAEYGDTVQTDVIDGRRGPLGRRTRTTSPTRLVESIETADAYDLVVVSVGHHRLQDAVSSLAPHIGDATMLVLGNVWDEPLAAVAPLAADRVLFGFPGAGGGFDADGVLHGAVLRSVRLGTTGTAPDRRELVRSVFQQAGFTVQDEDDIRGWLWLHVVLDAGMFAQALHSGGLATMVGDRRALREAFRIGRELLPVLEARGVDLSRHRSTTLPVRLPGTSATLVAAGTALVPIARASLAAHDDPTAAEPLAVLEDVRRTAAALGIPTPRLDRAARRA
ncbi:ketopantoate reductase family protein [Curtobacterium poinsettiae]|jgi:2-dehydropantoate 2-reductase|uniref:Ketopantoate reductase n=1 Tax=Curtobacterium poinsettiae TaxID=159612 RepID=A0ABT3S358_9MICO|nr:2-dehydropantoate 2-reductase N-terminal domain-containing protein [Curtobacterium flaccumfaciens]MBT1610947.1 ketopantoate reductase [Curtobacterium flaccumfaciens pv. poinsettiae]MCX2849219.1 ketopantoate reductase [Curtobacterium flaccumfaciens pv. poinsettiae]UXN20124.1 ketopantoate reductase [Curtobacterium flaccumfaciens pv. poinsettiae]